MVVDREQGGAEHLASQGIKMRSLVTLTEVLPIMLPYPHNFYH